MRGWLVVVCLAGCGRVGFDAQPDTLGDVMFGLPASCSDAVHNGDETGIDCGGSCGLACPGEVCGSDGACVTGRCEGTCELADLSWRPGPALVRNISEHACSVSTEGSVVVTGGEESIGNEVAGVQVLTAGAAAFVDATPLGQARSKHAMITRPDGTLMVFAGFGATPAIEMAVEEYTGTWTAGVPMVGMHAGISAAIGSDGRIYIPDLSTMEIFDPVARSWEVFTPARDSDGYGIVADGDWIYLMGGGNATNRADVDAFNVVTRTWDARAPMPTVRGSLAAVMGADRRIYAIGGTAMAAVADVAAYSPSRNTWTVTPPLPTARRSLCAAVLPDGRILAIGGRVGSAVDATTTAYGPAIALSPAAAAPGDTVTVTGTGFRASAAVGANIAGNVVATATSSMTGDFSATFVVPPLPAGTYPVGAADQRSQYPVTAALNVP